MVSIQINDKNKPIDDLGKLTNHRPVTKIFLQCCYYYYFIIM